MPPGRISRSPITGVKITVVAVTPNPGLGMWDRGRESHPCLCRARKCAPMDLSCWDRSPIRRMCHRCENLHRQNHGTLGTLPDWSEMILNYRSCCAVPFCASVLTRVNKSP
jgi:hypothetical protein